MSNRFILRIVSLGLAVASAGLVSGAVAPGTVAASGTPTCLARQLSARVVDWTGAAGSRIADVEIVNTSFVHCSLRDFPQVKLVSSSGAVLIAGAPASTTAHTHGLPALATLKTAVAASNYCGGAYTTPVTLAFALPGAAGQVIAIPAGSTTLSGVPPCNGAPGSVGHIAMQALHG
ncbi:MAG: DUF4232 domain-containing protein [Candidatus Limnocylindrales bacterium]